ncbi:MAG: hypothetical protein G01um101433_924 [Parcubacteria group bacterium Gr01-1014_33]|nr:MAG: hypothetical protein G01um101433_924 [Parcubacteria group bacterium Gr01-1014_33]
MVTKLFLLQCRIFGYNFVRLRKKTYHRSATALQVFLLVFLVSLKNTAFRNEIVL